jgi:phosphoglycolate phosphatase
MLVYLLILDFLLKVGLMVGFGKGNDVLPRAVLFDWDNTLVESWRSCMEAFNATLVRFGHPTVPQEEFLKRPQVSLRDGFPLLFGERWHEAERTYYSLLEPIHIAYMKPLQGAGELLEELYGQKIYAAVVSNKRGDILRREVLHLGWGHYFKKVIGARDAESDKPTLAPVRLALEQSGIALGQHIWFVGDSAVDMQCARNGGFTPILLGTQETAHSQGLDETSMWRMESCSQLRDFINSRKIGA